MLNCDRGKIDCANCPRTQREDLPLAYYAVLRASPKDLIMVPITEAYYVLLAEGEPEDVDKHPLPMLPEDIYMGVVAMPACAVSLGAEAITNELLSYLEIATVMEHAAEVSVELASVLPKPEGMSPWEFFQALIMESTYFPDTDAVEVSLYFEGDEDADMDEFLMNAAEAGADIVLVDEDDEEDEDREFTEEDLF